MHWCLPNCCNKQTQMYNGQNQNVLINILRQEVLGQAARPLYPWVGNDSGTLAPCILWLSLFLNLIIIVVHKERVQKGHTIYKKLCPINRKVLILLQSDDQKPHTITPTTRQAGRWSPVAHKLDTENTAFSAYIIH